MNNAQPGILANVPRFSRCLFFDLADGHGPAAALSCTASHAADSDLVLGAGSPLVADGELGKDLTGDKDGTDNIISITGERPEPGDIA
jgi:hypothetical protein